MRIPEIDWKQFLDDVAEFQHLPQAARQLFLEKVRPSQAITLPELGEYVEVLCASGFLVPGVRGKNASVPFEHRAFCRVIRSLHRHHIFDHPSRETFHNYLGEHFTSDEFRVVYHDDGDYFYGSTLYARIASIDWIKHFLSKSGQKGGNQSGKWGLGWSCAPEILRGTQQLVQQLMDSRAPITLAELRNLWPEGTSDLLPALLVEGMRHLVVFPALRDHDLEPVVGLWPSITRRLFRNTPKLPEPVAPHEVFEAPFLMDDMATIMSLCAAEPLRLRTGDFGLFERSYQSITSALGTLPQWVETQFSSIPTERVRQALGFLRQFEFLQQKGDRGKDLRLEVSEAGRKWLGLGAKGRLQTLMDGLLGKLKKRTELFEYEDDALMLLPHYVEFDSKKQEDTVRSALREAYAGHTSDAFVRIDAFLAYHSQFHNPLPKLAQQHPHVTISIRGSYLHVPSPDELEETWADLLRSFLHSRLVPLGGAKVGLDGGGAPCFALSDAGKYLLRVQSDFRYDQVAGRILVQPNFDVVFLAPAPGIETEFSRFAERRGRHTGTLFRITKRSILASAAAGLTLDHTLETLRQCCSADLPPNVEREISGWFGQCRRASLRHAVLIHCPDAETAARVEAISGRKATRLTDTVVELDETRTQGALLRKLREAGIFVDLD